MVDGWGIMTFDWGSTGNNQGALTVQAADGLKNSLKTAYGWSDAEAYKHVGISSMNGITDENAVVTLADMQTITAYAQEHTIARLTFWSLNRDRSSQVREAGEQRWALFAGLPRFLSYPSGKLEPCTRS